jgi:hypothetical protein
MKKLLLITGLALLALPFGADAFLNNGRSLQYPALRSVALKVTGARDTVLKAADETVASVQNTAAEVDARRIERNIERYTPPAKPWSLTEAITLLYMANDVVQAAVKADMCSDYYTSTASKTLSAPDLDTYNEIFDEILPQPSDIKDKHKNFSAFCKAFDGR